MHIYIYTHTHTHTYTYVCIYICTYICIHICTHQRSQGHVPMPRGRWRGWRRSYSTWGAPLRVTFICKNKLLWLLVAVVCVCVCVCVCVSGHMYVCVCVCVTCMCKKKLLWLLVLVVCVCVCVCVQWDMDVCGCVWHASARARYSCFCRQLCVGVCGRTHVCVCMTCICKKKLLWLLVSVVCVCVCYESCMCVRVCDMHLQGHVTLSFLVALLCGCIW